jgi:predicted GTPase
MENKSTANVDRWWFKNLRSIVEHESLDEMRDIVKAYRPGSLLQEDSPELLSLLNRYGPEKNLRVLVLGPSGAGKSTLIDGIFTAFEDTDIQYYRCSTGVEKTHTATTIIPRSNDIRNIVDGKVVSKISLVDSRGIVDSAKMQSMDEVLQLLLGNTPIGQLSRRPGDEIIGKNSSIVIPPECKRFHLGIVVIPADGFDNLILKICKQLFSEYFPILCVVTKVEKEEGEEKGKSINHWAKKLNIHQEDVFTIENYNVDTNNSRNEKTDRKLLHILLSAIRKAELEGFQSVSKDQESCLPFRWFSFSRVDMFFGFVFVNFCFFSIQGFFVNYEEQIK